MDPDELISKALTDAYGKREAHRGRGNNCQGCRAWREFERLLEVDAKYTQPTSF